MLCAATLPLTASGLNLQRGRVVAFSIGVDPFLQTGLRPCAGHQEKYCKNQAKKIFIVALLMVCLFKLNFEYEYLLEHLTG